MPIRVLVVDDSVVVRRIVSDVLSADPRIDVVGWAANGRLAQAKVEQLRPDLVTMDVEMPELDGIGAVRALRAAGHQMPVIMFSTLTERGAAATLDALAAGATDYVTKPTGMGSVREGLAQVAKDLVPRILALVPRDTAVDAGPDLPVPRAKRPERPEVVVRDDASRHGVKLLLVGASTGGPDALSRLLGSFTAPPPVPVLVVQHMPPVFTRQLAARLDRVGPARVHEAVADEELLPGHVYVAPGDHHLVVDTHTGVLRAGISDDAPINFCRPSVDALFRSAVRAVRGEVLAVVLTGMGADGRTGCEDVVQAGGTVLVQDEASSVVWGMPGAVATAGLAHQVLPMAEIPAAVELVLELAGSAAGTAGGGTR
ncbi:chemotaxis response regulator protein-glutamate methylesterase 1 [Cellulomonas chitinilytica]|uniref:Protein-glutamate methylesterase/protein-glutamine glutaminase n=2 Tax=Cellulomonas chitinilytica TaxID=398759 RepID=A0A919P834_9CELL|nr:chemotaxis response regulator protein-glutamate methylesterase 1 [Cellulomonas chitinilytica]